MQSISTQHQQLFIYAWTWKVGESNVESQGEIALSFPSRFRCLCPKPDLNTNPKRSRQICEKQLRNIIVSLLRYVIGISFICICSMYCLFFFFFF